MNKFELARQFGKALSTFKIDLALLHLQKVVRKKNYIRAVIYHDTPKNFSTSLEKHFAFYQKHFSPVSKQDLNRFFQTGHWNKPKPGLMITFDDGLKSNFEIALPLLEKFGFVGWFFIPTGLVDAPGQMSWKEIQKLDQNHEIGCHTQSHLRMQEGLSKEILQKEIGESKKILENKLSHPVDLFCWVGGELQTYTRSAHNMIQKTGYHYAFMTNSKAIGPKTNPYFLDRTYVEPFWDIKEVTFMLSGMIDLLYSKKRRQIIYQLGF